MRAAPLIRTGHTAAAIVEEAWTQQVDLIILGSSVRPVLRTLVIGIANFPFPQSQGEPTGKYPVVTLGQALLGDYLIPFEIASVLLLVVMIGAAYLAKARKRKSELGSQELAAGSQ